MLIKNLKRILNKSSMPEVKVEDILKSRLVLILILLNIIFLFTSVGSCNYSGRLKKLRDQEMDTRFTAQENAERLEREKNALETTLQDTKDELVKERTDLEEVKKNLVQEQLINQSLKTELEKLNKLKQALEEDLKEALVTGRVQRAK